MDRRELIKRAAVVGGAAWVAPTVLGATAASAVTCQCYGFRIVASSTCSVEDESPNFGNNCTNANNHWAAVMGTTNCPNGVTGSCSGYGGASVSWSGTNQGVTIVFPTGATPLFLGVRYNNGCAYLSCNSVSPYAGFTANCTSIAESISDATPSTGASSPMKYVHSTRTFTATVSGWSGSSKPSGISHVMFAFKKCGS